jgi:transposase
VWCLFLGVSPGQPKRYELSDAEWERLSPLLPAERGTGGRPARPHREVLNAILWVLCTGSPWRDVPERYGPWATAWSRFRRWQEAGVWDRVWVALKREHQAGRRVDWTALFLDSTVIRAHQHAAGGKGGPARRRSAAAAGASRPSSTWRSTAPGSRSASS